MTAIEFNNVGKMYRLGTIGTGTLSHDLNRWWQTSVLHREDPYLKIGQTNDRTTKGDSQYVWALQDINFKVEQGDVVGIIGKNGAGKSTLLKLLSNITSPTTGTITYEGRIASLLEVGTGFHPEMTGRENIYMNGAIMGMTRQEITRKLDEIVDFAGCARYIDTPVKRYSSGMTVRLGFAIAAFLEPEILVVDEVLAVGDAEFQKKAIGKMQDVSKGEGRTVLFVSHNMNSIKQLCNHAVLLKTGTVEYYGSVEDTVARYVSDDMLDIKTHIIATDSDRSDKGKYRRNTQILEATLLNKCPNAMATDEPVEIEILIKRNKVENKTCQVCVAFTNAEDIRVSYHVSNIFELSDITKVKVKITGHSLPKGAYKMRIEIGLREFTGTETYNFDAIDNALSFYVKYLHKDKQDEYLVWNNAWGLQYQDKNNVLAEVLSI